MRLRRKFFDAHLMMLDDPDFVEGMTNIVTDEKVCAEYACFVNCENFQAMFRALDDEIYAGACSRHR